MKHCKKCGVETERYSNGTCKPCRKLYDAARYEVQSEKYKDYSKKYRAENPQQHDAWVAANPEKQRARTTAYHAKNKARGKELSAIWLSKNPDAQRIKAHNYRERRRANGGQLSIGLAQRLFKLQRGKCACCAEPLGDNYHLDHIVPLALGGANKDENIQLLRAVCNLNKGRKNPIAFMQERGFLL